MCASYVPCRSTFAQPQYVFVHCGKDAYSQVVRGSVGIALMSRFSRIVVDIHPRLTEEDVIEIIARAKSAEMLAERWARRGSGGCDQLRFQLGDGRQGARVGIARTGGGPENLAALLTIGPRLPRVCLRVLVIAMIHPERLCSHKPHSHNAFVLTPPSCADEMHPIASRPPLRV